AWPAPKTSPQTSKKNLVLVLYRAKAPVYSELKLFEIILTKSLWKDRRDMQADPFRGEKCRFLSQVLKGRSII
ncbi:hypothetical protein HAX54_033197, partial [Datura stramonium]|nr:hypothetical protein [Datura stramonium]